MRVKSESEVAQSHPTLRNPMDYSLPGSSIHGIFQARVLEWTDTAFSAAGTRHSRLQVPKKQLGQTSYLGHVLLGGHACLP